MGPTIMLLGGVLTGLTAALLTPWMRALARTDSAWLSSGLHILLAVAGGAGAAALAHTWTELTAYTALALACALLVVIDLAAYRLPDIIVGPMYPILFATLTTAAAVNHDWNPLGRAAAGAGTAIVGYLVLAFISPSGLGLGDVKLSGLLGAFLGWLSWQQAAIGAMAAFIIGGICAAILLLSRTATRTTAFPFGPSMVAGAALAAALGPTLVLR